MAVISVEIAGVFVMIAALSIFYNFLRIVYPENWDSYWSFLRYLSFCVLGFLLITVAFVLIRNSHDVKNEDVIAEIVECAPSLREPIG